jgi:hypothetical protein
VSDAAPAYGFFSFTEITDPGEHRAYNEWHQLDHLPEQFGLPGITFGQRWVSTPACRRARAVDGDVLGPAHYVTLYLMREPIGETLRAFGALGQELRARGRFHEHRRAVLSGPFAVVERHAAPRTRIGAGVLPHRPHLGVYVVVRPTPADTGCAGRALSDPSVAGVWRFESEPGLGGGPWSPGNRSVTVCFLDGPPLDAAPRLSVLLESTAGVELAGPFETVTPWRWDWFETDAY